MATATLSDVARLALALPGVEEIVRFRHRAWRASDVFVWERPYSKADRAREPVVFDGEIIALTVTDEGEKRALIEAEPQYFFTISHFDGYNAVLLRLDSVPLKRLDEAITEAYQTVTGS